MTRSLEAIVFDFDGVIADSERLHLLAYQQVLATLGLELTEAAYQADYLGYDDARVFRMYARNKGQTWDAETVERLMHAKAERYEGLWARGEMLFPGSAAFIRRAALAVPLAIASGALTREVEEILEQADLRALFAVVVGADQTRCTKPAPDPYLEAFGRLEEHLGRRLDPQRTVAIEDSRWGLESAGAAGLRRVAVANTFPSAELAEYAELVVSGLHELTLEALDSLCDSVVRS